MYDSKELMLNIDAISAGAGYLFQNFLFISSHTTAKLQFFLIMLFTTIRVQWHCTVLASALNLKHLSCKIWCGPNVE